MKKFLLFLLLNVCFSYCFSQDNPYAVFGYKSNVEYKDSKEDIYWVRNINSKSQIKVLKFDFKNHLISYLDQKDSVLATMNISADQILRFISPDPLTGKYPELTPFQFASNTPIRAVDLDGLEGVIIGGADVSSTGKVSETINTITSTVKNNLNAANIKTPVKSFNVTNSDTRTLDIKQTQVYKDALNFIKTNYKPDKPLVLYGYSYGGAVIDALQGDLFKSGYKINTMVLVDANRGNFTDLHPLVMSNVGNVYDFYQDTHNLLGSRGFAAEKTFSNSPTVLNNYDISNAVPLQPGYIPKSWSTELQKTNRHSNIDETTMQISISLITNGLKN